MQSTAWQLVLNRNQNLLGKCFLALRRHLENVTELQSAEWLDLQPQLKVATQGLIRAFEPDHFNYAFLQNQDRHVHLHIMPRYAQIRTFAGMIFEDSDYPAHYSVPTASVFLPEERFEELAERLRGQMVS